ncbi:MAG: hypothetical protein C0489_11260 [Candidatus Accumulibacter sp.]|nr:hypothetical protein [Accumulibacter sp.]
MSLPRPPTMTSAPRPPSRMSLPARPTSSSSKIVPVRVSLAEVPTLRSPTPPVACEGIARLTPPSSRKLAITRSCVPTCAWVGVKVALVAPAMFTKTPFTSACHW